MAYAFYAEHWMVEQLFLFYQHVTALLNTSDVILPRLVNMLKPNKGRVFILNILPVLMGFLKSPNESLFLKRQAIKLGWFLNENEYSFILTLSFKCKMTQLNFSVPRSFRKPFVWNSHRKTETIILLYTPRAVYK